jgi:PAS domain S-box-containing protein
MLDHSKPDMRPSRDNLRTRRSARELDDDDVNPAQRSTRRFIVVTMLVALIVLAWIWESSKIRRVWDHPLAERLGETVLVLAASAVIYVLADGRRRALEQSRAELALLVDGVPDPVLSIDDEGSIRSVNPAARRAFGVVDEPVAGLSIAALLPDLPWPPPPPAGGGSPGGQVTSTAAGVNGRAFPAEVTFGTVLTAGQRRHIAVVRDLTERVEAERALRDAEDRFGLFVQLVRDYAIFTLDASGRVASWNVGAERIKGYRAEEVLGRPFSMFYPPEDVAAGLPDRELRDAARLGSVEEEGWRVRADGSRFFANVVVTAVHDDEGVLRGFAKVTRDISDRKRAEEEREAMEEQLRQAQRLESIGRLAGGVAHDFNNLLTVILGGADLLAQRTVDDPTSADAVARLTNAAQRGARLTKQLLTFSRSDAAQPSVVDVCSSLDGVVELFARTLGAGIEVTTSIEPDLAPVLLDPADLEQVVLNLAVNAADAMPGSGQLSIRCVNLDLTAPDRRFAHLAPGRYVSIQVTDTGTGMDEATMPLVFEPFFTTKSRGQGTGLGLSIVYGVVTSAGGSVHVASSLGSGTTMTIVLPAAELPDDDLASATPSSAMPSLLSKAVGPGAALGRSLRVLVVDDEPDVANVTARMLEEAGHRTRWAASGVDALDLLAAEAFDVVVTDVIMPGLDGVELACIVRDRHPSCSVVFVSGYPGGAGQLDGPLLEKPFTASELLTLVTSVPSAAG